MFIDTHAIQPLSKSGNSHSHKGKIVGNITITKLNPFETFAADSSKRLINWVKETGNKLHITTKDKVVLNNMLLKEGDKLTRHALVESERLLRALPFILDARVYGVARKLSPDTIDVYVITKDVFSASIKIKPTQYDEWNLTLEENNMFGLGQNFYNNIIINAGRKMGYEAQYTVYNLYGTFMQGDLNLAFTDDSLLARISNERQFITHEIRNAGGLSYHYRVFRYYSRYDESRARTRVADNNFDGWYGRRFPIPTRDSLLLGHLNFVLSGRVSSTIVTERPFADADTNLAFQTNTLMLGSFGFSRAAFAKDILIEGFGVTEDVPIGLLADVTLGYSLGEFVSRPYAGIRVSSSVFVKQGYFFNSVELGFFFHNKKFSDGALRITSLYISKLIGAEKIFKGRIQLRGQYIRGLNRTNENDRVDLNDLDGLRRLRTERLFGNAVLTGGATLSIFTPWHLLGFRLVLFSSTDLTYFSKRDAFVFSGRPYWGISSGIRLNNQHFVIGTIDIRVTIYPSPPEGTPFFGIGVSLNPIFPFPNFIGKKPDIVQYGNPSKLYY